MCMFSRHYLKQTPRARVDSIKASCIASYNIQNWNLWILKELNSLSKVLFSNHQQEKIKRVVTVLTHTNKNISEHTEQKKRKSYWLCNPPQFCCSSNEARVVHTQSGLSIQLVFFNCLANSKNTKNHSNCLTGLFVFVLSVA